MDRTMLKGMIGHFVDLELHFSEEKSLKTKQGLQRAKDNGHYYSSYTNKFFKN
jgi:hypothetical protein